MDQRYFAKAQKGLENDGGTTKPTQAIILIREENDEEDKNFQVRIL